MVLVIRGGTGQLTRSAGAFTWNGAKPQRASNSPAGPCFLEDRAQVADGAFVIDCNGVQRLNGNGVKLKYPWLKSMNFKNDAELKRKRELTTNLSIRRRIRTSGEN